MNIYRAISSYSGPQTGIPSHEYLSKLRIALLKNSYKKTLDKKTLDAKTTLGHRGYDVLASQSYQAEVLPDLKEVGCSNASCTHID